MIFKSMLGRIL
jgi:hypothetical protein